MPTATGIRMRARSNVWVPAGAWCRVGPLRGPATGPTTPPSATPGFRAIHGAGSLTIAAFGATTPSVGDGLRVAVEGWRPVIVVRNDPPGWRMPVRPIHPGPGIYPPPGQRLVAVDRGPVAKGPWAFRGAAPKPDHQQALNFNGRTVVPVGRVDVRALAFPAAKGTAPGARAVLSGAPVGAGRSPYVGGANPARGAETFNPRSNRVTPAGQSYNQRSTYVARPAPSPHYSAPPPPPHYSAPPPPPPHYSAPPPSGPRR